MIFVPDKKINLSQLRDEARAAGGIPANAELGVFGKFVFMYDGAGNPIPFPNEAAMQTVIDNHVAMRPITNDELYTRYADANNKHDVATMNNLVAQAQGLIPRILVAM